MESEHPEAERRAARAWIQGHFAVRVLKLPSACVRTAVHVQHLPGHIPRFNQVDYRVHDVLRFGDGGHWREGFQKVLRILFMHRRIYDARRDSVEADMLSGVFVREAQGDGVEAAFGKHWNGRGRTEDGVVRKGGSNRGHAASRVLREHLLHGKLSHEDKAVKVGGYELVKVVGAVIRKGPGGINPGVVDQMIDGTEC